MPHAITPHLWFDREAWEAAEFYVSLIPGSKITRATTLRSVPSGRTELVSFELAGQPFAAVSAGPLFRFNPSVSFRIKCATKHEVDTIWEKLAPGGRILMSLGHYSFSERYGWVEDRYGLSWQVVFAEMAEPRVIPVLTFTEAVCGRAEEAMDFYTSIFGDSPANILARYGEGEDPDREGAVKYASFALRGQEFGAIDSARQNGVAFNEAVSFMVPCDTQEEIDHFWEKLSADPGAEQCGWLKDKYGLSWQITPAALSKFLGNDDKARTERVTQAFLKMKKFDLSELERAYEGK